MIKSASDLVARKDCSQIDGGLNVHLCHDCTNLDPLSLVTAILGSDRGGNTLRIEVNLKLEHVDGLSGVSNAFAGGVQITENPRRANQGHWPGKKQR